MTGRTPRSGSALLEAVTADSDPEASNQIAPTARAHGARVAPDCISHSCRPPPLRRPGHRPVLSAPRRARRRPPRGQPGYAPPHIPGDREATLASIKRIILRCSRRPRSLETTPRACGHGSPAGGRDPRMALGGTAGRSGVWLRVAELRERPGRGSTDVPAASDTWSRLGHAGTGQPGYALCAWTSRVEARVAPGARAGLSTGSRRLQRGLGGEGLGPLWSLAPRSVLARTSVAATKTMSLRMY
ncbi:MAG: hypothetical protein QOK16_2325 [Solirubrobacteraceae bacterium]|nr:hypothetical protein [Solirubrobacteraceae bacterium]MEA2187314.1 hypothetical protein [Solirubrobacteraceae bacterium]